MSAQIRKQPGRSRAGKKAKTTSGWMRWWPLLLGAAVTPAAVKIAEILPLTGAGGLAQLRLLYPFAMLLRQHALDLPEASRESLSQVMLYAQFPIYGLYASIVMRWRSWGAALVQTAAIHLAGFGLLWLLTKK